MVCGALGQQEEPTQAERPDPPKPAFAAPDEKWELYTVKSYQSIRPTSQYNPVDKRTEIWEEYRLILRSKTRVQVALSCGQWVHFNDFTRCAQGVLLPYDKVWTRVGVSGKGEEALLAATYENYSKPEEGLWVYSNEKPKLGLRATFWHVDSREAE